MNLNQQQSEALRKFAPQLESFSRPSLVWIYFLLIPMAVGAYALYVQVVKGHIVTGMRDNVVWGLYIANFIFFIGIGYAGAVISGILHLLKISWRKPVIRVAELITVIATIIGPVFILLCIGRLDRLHHLVLYARLQSPIVWDALAITTYLFGGILLLYVSSIKDFAIYRDSTELKIQNWRRRLYKALSLNYQGTAIQKKSLAVSMNLLSILIIPLVIIVSSILSWIFGMTLRPGWHSTIFGPYFVVAAIYSGTGVLIVAMWIYRKVYNLNTYMQDVHFVKLGYVMMILSAAYGYFTFSEYLTDWYMSEKWNGEVIRKLFDMNQFGRLFLLSNLGGIVLPIFVMAIPKLRKPGPITLAAAFMVLAMWVKRYLIIIPTLESPLLSIQDTRAEYIHYTPTWVEWAISLGGFASFFLLFTLASKFLTIISVSEFETSNNE